MGSPPNDAFLELVEAMKRSAAVLRDAKVPFLLGGGLASWARGGPPTDHDVDFLVRERDIGRAEEALAAAGLRLERPPEGWLVKAWDGDVLVDLIFHPAGGPVTDEHFEHATILEVAAQPLPVASIEDVLAAKLLALTEQEPDYGPVLETADMQVGVVGTKGFVGGFPGAEIADFGERLLREVYAETSRQVEALEAGLEAVAGCERRLVLLHYAPVSDTLVGEPEGIWAFLGSGRLAGPIGAHRPEAVFHGHAHHGRPRGAIGSVPVYNVARHVIETDFALVRL
jgi:hypothetical protein